MPATKRSACVAPELDLRECTLHMPPHKKANKTEPTLALKPRGDVTRNPKRGIIGPKMNMFWFSGNVVSGFQSQSGFTLCRDEVNVI